MNFKLIRILVFSLIAVFMAGQSVQADVVDNIKKRGKLIVGVKADYKPYGFRDTSGKIVGIEPELAQDVADMLGVKLELVPVVASNRMEFLKQGKIDLMIATMTDRADRAKMVFILQPNYYSSGTNVFATKKAGLKDWEDLRGKPVCGIQGAFYNKRTAKEFGASIVAFKGTAEVLNALQQGRCVGFVYDDSFIIAKLQDPKWADYEMPLPTMDDAPWGLAVKHGEYRFYGMMSEMIMKWHASGRIIELEMKYDIAPTPFAVKMNKIFSGKK
ncbi:ABC transporter, substrate-binding protein (cluster 3, basic aa/glutamine/opines) [Olavius sp. associated proteobacterium Delta 1]|nr:ABC transporter, substrate-binding protein (cluster 3, basic aa/glutamine/opines) [Olavius sp. associated proteobacterium Delta 1]